MPNPTHIVEQYRTVRERGGLYHRVDRGVIDVLGKDRSAWLNNLVTNIVKNLTPGEGNYAFATNIKGRTVFDLGILAIEDRLWLDVDRRWIDTALKHLNKYVITEDVQLQDLSNEINRLAVMGPAAHELVSAVGLGNLTPMAQWQHVHGQFGDVPLGCVRNDFAGCATADLYLCGDSREAAARELEKFTSQLGLPRIDADTINILRIESGIPASVDDIDEEVVPPETGRVEQGISYHKGCYLGQEVIERMRSHGILAKRLVGLKIGGDLLPPRNSTIKADEKDVGRITSSCWSEALSAPLALGYVKTAFAQPGKQVLISASNGVTPAEVVALPLKS
jgi:folate-binding protein YgfZ